MLAKCFFVGFLSSTSPVSRKPRMWSPTYTGTALSESPANQVTVRVVESGSRDASVWALRHSERCLLQRDSCALLTYPQSFQGARNLSYVSSPRHAACD